MNYFRRRVSKEYGRVECYVSTQLSSRCADLSPHKNLLLHLRSQSFTQQTLRSHMTTCSLMSIQSSFTSEVAKDTMSEIKRFGVEENDFLTNPDLNKLPLNVALLRLQFLAEGGMKPNMSFLTDFYRIAGSSPSALKSAGLLPRHIDIVHKMLTSVKFDGPPPSKVDMNASYEEIHFQIVCHCLNYYFGFSFPSWKRYHYASLKFSIDNIKSLLGVNIGWRWIANRPSMICYANPYNLKRVCGLQQTYELPVRLGLLLRRDAEIAFVNFEDIRAIFFLLMKYEVCRHDNRRTHRFDHFLLNPDILDKLFKQLRIQYPEDGINLLGLLYKEKHIVHQRKPMYDGYIERLVIRQNYPTFLCDDNSPIMEKSWQHELKLWLESDSTKLTHKPCHHAPYEFISKRGKEDLLKLSDGDHVISATKRIRAWKSFAYSFDLPEEYVKSELSRIPCGLTVPVNKAKDSLKFLYECDFSKEDIAGSLQLLLYSKKVIKETMDKHVKSDPVYGSETYKRRHLQLCLYHILIKYNFCLEDP